MTNKADFAAEEWETVLEGPPSAGLLVITAQRGGTLRETVSMAKAYAEARQNHGQSELLDEIVSAKPEIDHTRYHSPEELKERSLAHLRDAVALVEAKGTPAELDEYRSLRAAPRGQGRERAQGGWSRRDARERRRAGGDRGDRAGARRARRMTVPLLPRSRR